jgi:Holin of 3TMs, for gene-transfer release
MSNFMADFFSSGIEGAAKGIGSLAKDLRSAITGEAPIDSETQLKLEQIAVQLEQVEQQLPLAVNQTMQAEAKSEHWPQYSWRPFWGFISGLAFAFVVGLCCYLGYQAVGGGQPEALAMIPQLVSSFAALFAIPGAILGVSAWHRGKEKIERIKAN